jgi:flagellar basal-body rod protein FlgC
MNYLHAFAISASGLAVEKARVDVTAVNLANASSTRSADGTAFRPLRVVSAARAPEFAGVLQQALRGAEVLEVRPLDTAPRLAYEPGHPDADDRGFVAYPGINPVSEMMNLLTAVRVYEANVAALGAARAMALRTLELGG